MNWRLSAHTQLRFIALIFDCESFLFSPSTHNIFVHTSSPHRRCHVGWLKMWFHWRYRRHSTEKAETTQTSDITHHICTHVSKSRGERMLIDISRVSIGFSFFLSVCSKLFVTSSESWSTRNNFSAISDIFHFKANFSSYKSFIDFAEFVLVLFLLFRNHLRSSAAIGIGEILNSALELISETQRAAHSISSYKC